MLPRPPAPPFVENGVLHATITINDPQALDLSEMRFKFEVRAADVESPNNCAIRIYNLSDEAMVRVRGEYTRRPAMTWATA